LEAGRFVVSAIGDGAGDGVFIQNLPLQEII
jgi:hypothetical protein